jgi:tRNA (guanine37-N1)-methyltransferase
MKIIFFTLFKELILPYFEYSILKRAKDLIEVVDFREFSKNGRVDTELVGGGAGMVIDNYALREALKKYKILYSNARVIFLTPVGKTYNQKDAIRFAKEDVIFLVSGRYEGFDERLIEDFADEVISIGDYILSGGELASLVVADSILRNIDGIVGNSESLIGESFENNLLEAPNFSKMGEVPGILKSGNHKKIEKYKKNLSILKTKFHRIDLYLEARYKL